MGGPLSAVPGFDGETIVTAVRLEQALAVQAQRHAVKHVAVTTLDEAAELLLFDGADWSPTPEEIELSSKEFTTRTRVWLRGAQVAP